MTTTLRHHILPYLTAFAVAVAAARPTNAQPPAPPGEGKTDIGSTSPQAAREPGYLGLITDDRREQGQGVRVVRVLENTPGARAGFKVDDLIVAIDGQPTGSLNEMAAQLEPRSSSDKIRFEVRRGNTTETLEVILGRRPASGRRPFEFGRIPERLPEPSGGPALPDEPATGFPTPNMAGAGPAGGQLLGIRSAAVGEDFRVRHSLPSASGARVVSRVVGSPADQASIPLDAVIVAVDGQPVESPTDLARRIAAAGPGRQVELTYYSGGEKQQAIVRLAEGRRPPLPADGALPEPRLFPRPIDPQAAAMSTAARIEQLERRIGELEQRLQRLERASRN